MANIMELLPREVQLNINRILDEELWNLTKLLTIIKYGINAREKCTTAIEQERAGKNVFSSEEPLSAVSLFAGLKSKPLSAFCTKPYWSDKCRTISDPSSRKQFFKQVGYCFLCLKIIKFVIVTGRKVVFTARDCTIPLFVLRDIKRMIRIKRIPPVERLIIQQRATRAKPINTSGVFTNSCSNS